jgi:hypothetical protein
LREGHNPIRRTYAANNLSNIAITNRLITAALALTEEAKKSAQTVPNPLQALKVFRIILSNQAAATKPTDPKKAKEYWRRSEELKSPKLLAVQPPDILQMRHKILGPILSPYKGMVKG